MRSVQAAPAALVIAAALLGLLGPPCADTPDPPLRQANTLTGPRPAAVQRSGPYAALPGRRRDSRLCRSSGVGRFDCGDAGWMYVGSTEQVVGGRKERCVWAHPLPRGRRIEITYPPTAQGAPLQLQTALSDRAVSGRGAPVMVEVRWGPLRRTIRHDDARGWRTTELAAPPAPAPLTLIVRADRTGRRHFCYKLEAAP